jgi:hypothetical protein
MLEPVNMNPDEHCSQPKVSVCTTFDGAACEDSSASPYKLFRGFADALEIAVEPLHSKYGVELVVTVYCPIELRSNDWFEVTSPRLRSTTIKAYGEYSRGQGMNLAARVCRSNWLFLCDVDLLATTEVLARGIASLSTGKAYFPIPSSQGPDETSSLKQMSRFCASFVTREKFWESGGCPENVTWSGGDNVLFAQVAKSTETYRDAKTPIFSQLCSDFNSLASGDTCVRVFQCSHPMWSGELLLYPNGRAVRPGVDEANFELVDGVRLNLFWDRWPAELLVWDSQLNSYVTENRQFVVTENGF